MDDQDVLAHRIAREEEYRQRKLREEQEYKERKARETRQFYSFPIYDDPTKSITNRSGDQSTKASLSGSPRQLNGLVSPKFINTIRSGDSRNMDDSKYIYSSSAQLNRQGSTTNLLLGRDTDTKCDYNNLNTTVLRSPVHIPHKILNSHQSFHYDDNNPPSPSSQNSSPRIENAKMNAEKVARDRSVHERKQQERAEYFAKKQMETREYIKRKSSEFKERNEANARKRSELLKAVEKPEYERRKEKDLADQQYIREKMEREKKYMDDKSKREYDYSKSKFSKERSYTDSKLEEHSYLMNKQKMNEEYLAYKQSRELSYLRRKEEESKLYLERKKQEQKDYLLEKQKNLKQNSL